MPYNNSEQNNLKNTSISQLFLQNGKCILGCAGIAAGCVFASDGIYEYFTGNKLGVLVNNFNLPNMLKYTVNHLDSMTTQLKCGGGSALIGIGNLLFFQVVLKNLI